MTRRLRSGRARLALFLLGLLTALSLGLPAEAGALGGRRVLLAPKTVLLLDGRRDVAAAYALQKVVSAYKGAGVRLRRASDSAEVDVYFDRRGRLQFTSALGWAAGSSLFVTTWYEQSGNARHLTQATATAQPAIALLSNGLPGMTFDGSNDFLITAAFAISQPTAFSVVYRRVTMGQPSFANLFSSSAADANTFYRSNGASSGNSMWSGSAFTTDDIAQPTGTRGAVGGTFNGASSLMDVNAATVSSFTGDANTTGFNGLTVGTNFSQNAQRFDNSEMQALILFNTGHTSAQHKADNAALRAAWRF